MPALKTVIILDKLSVPVSMNRATVDTDMQLHEFHTGDLSRTCRKTLCSGCGKELTAEDIVKGYEQAGQSPVLLGKEELRKLKDESENRIDILYSTSMDLISPVYYSTSYIAVPDAGSEEAFELLRLSLSEERLILIGRAVIGGMDSVLAVAPAEDGLVVSKLYFENELVSPKKPYQKPPVTQYALEPVRSLLSDMYAAFDLSGYENEYQKRLRELVASKLGATP